MAVPEALATKDNAPGTPTQPLVPRVRLESVDLVRGVIMIIMALDHTRDFLGIIAFSPTDVTRTTVPIFLTRWITYFCAPVFFLLTGTGAYLSLRRKSKSELSRFLFTRGLWLIFLEITVFRCLGFQFNFDYKQTLLNVLWALGWAMITLSLLVHIPVAWTTAIGILMIAAHNLLDPIPSTNAIWNILHRPGFVIGPSQHSVFVAYPLIPWMGVTAVGYGLGQVYAWTPERRQKFLLRAGLAATAAFVIVRFINIYGDPLRWSAQKSASFTALSFLNTLKYPPSLLFLLMTLGPALLFLWAVDGHTPRLLRPALIIGKVPMFFYLLHMPIIHLIAVVACYARYGQIHWMFESPTVDKFPATAPPGWGFSLPVVYLFWISGVIALYPLCSWFAALKQRRSDPWLSYL